MELNVTNMPQVIDGHHRAAAIKSGVKIPVACTTETLIRLWKDVYKSTESVKSLREKYSEYLK